MDYRELAETVGPRTGATQEWVFRVLREGIISGKLKGGTQLKQDEVSAALTVSHIPVREALRQLEAQGLVTIHPNRGSTVTQLSRSDLEDMMEIRASISYYIARRAIPLMSEEDLNELQAVIEEQKKAQDMFEEERLNYKFHEVLTRRAPAGRPVYGSCPPGPIHRRASGHPGRLPGRGCGEGQQPPPRPHHRGPQVHPRGPGLSVGPKVEQKGQQAQVYSQ